MSNLSVIQKVRVETIPASSTVVISSSVSTALICLKCGQIKGVYSYFGVEKDPIYNRGTCLCLYNAPNPGGGAVVHSNGQEELLRAEQRKLLANLWQLDTIEEIKMSIPLTPARNRYSEDFRTILDRIYTATSIKDARHIIELYASADDMRGVQ